MEKIETQVETEMETEMETEIETQVETEMETQAETEMETEMETQVETEMETETETEMENPSVTFDTTYTHVIENFGFGGIPITEVIEIYKDGRPFSHFVEAWLAHNYPLTRNQNKCGKYDFTDRNNENIKYDEKTFTKGGCKFMPSNMIGEGRTFNKEIFEKKAKKLIYIIVSNIHFPVIKIKFVRGIHLMIRYPTGIIPLKDFHKFFD